MSGPHAGPPDPPGQPTDRGEFRSQQGVERGYVAAIEDMMDTFKTYYVPEYEKNGQRFTTEWRRGGVPGAPPVDSSPPERAPNYFIGEQYLELNYAPQMLVFARAPIPVRPAPTPMVGWHRTGYRQISAAIYTIQVRIWAFDDDDGQELFNYLVAATYESWLGSTPESCWESLAYMPKRVGTRGTVMEFGLKLGVPITPPPKAVACSTAINQRTAICTPPKNDT